jgi:hypothetical protein
MLDMSVYESNVRLGAIGRDSGEVSVSLISLDFPPLSRGTVAREIRILRFEIDTQSYLCITKTTELAARALSLAVSFTRIVNISFDPEALKLCSSHFVL